MRALIVAVAALGSLGAAAPRGDELAKELAGRVAGTPVDCVDASFVGGPQIIDERTLLYRQSGRRVWRNDLPDACPGLRPMDTMVIEIHGNRLCRGDHFRTMSPGMSIPGAVCRLGAFTPYDRPTK